MIMYRFLYRMEHVFWLLLSLFIRCFTRINKKRILSWSYYYTKYSCSPRYITEYLLKEHPGKFELYWCFNKDVDVSQLPSEIKIVRWRTWKYLLILNSSAFLFTNTRTGLWKSSFVKKKGQRYVMTWHSSMGIKKIEQDAEETLSLSYINEAKYDSSICDLILSGCKFRTEVIKRVFWYDGEILEKGTPRNDVLFQDHTELKQRIFAQCDIPKNTKILLYAPTFRKDMGLQYYKFNWDDVLPALEEKFGSPMFIFLRLHPNFCRAGIDVSALCQCERVLDVTYYHDMHELLCISDVLITDYSSSLFDFSLLHKPCFIYATDYESYDRGTYFRLEELPFPLALNNAELFDVISQFDKEEYESKLTEFNKRILCSYETGKACEALYQWMTLC